MRVSQSMTRNVEVVHPDDSIAEAAQLMSQFDIGSLPVAENDRLIGMLTDRDIVIRAVARGLGPDTAIRAVMSTDVKYCFEDQSIEEVIENMAAIQVRRLPVINRDKRLVGIVSLGDLALEEGTEEEAGKALKGVSRPGGEHSQSGMH
jgi:CBS domain-containing protein